MKPGDRIGAYRLERLLGRGSQGTVHQARADDGRTVAIKVLAEKVASASEDRKRFAREVVAASRIDHPNVIQVLDSGETEDGRLYLVTELLEGRSLAAEIGAAELGSAGSLAPGLVAAIGARCASALGRAHELGVVHRDVKPSNVFVCRDGEVKLLDFGLASVRGEQPLTAEGMVLGTPMYIAPEQVVQKSGPPADVYSLGCVLYEALTGLTPFRGNAVEVVRKHLRESPPSPRMLRPKIPEALDRLVTAMLVKDATRRPTAIEVRDLLGLISREAPAPR